MITVFSFNGEYPVVVAHGPARTMTPKGVGVHGVSARPEKYPIGSLLNERLEIVPEDDFFSDLKQLARDEVMRLYEQQVYGVEGKPTDLVLEEWRQKELLAERYLSGQLPQDLQGHYQSALLAGITQKEILTFSAQTPALVPGNDDVAIATKLAEDIVGAALAKRTLLTFAGAQRRDANDLIDMATDYLDLAAKVLHIQEQVPIRTAGFLAQFA